MSSVRMCDRCGTIFSENDEGWSTDSRTITRTREDGKRYTVGMSVDQCSACVGGTAPVAPRIPAPAHAITPGTLEQEIKAAEDADKDATLVLLQLQVADLKQKLEQHGADKATAAVAGTVITGMMTPTTAYHPATVAE